MTKVARIITKKQAKASGRKTYFTGEPCQHGHVCERFVNAVGVSSAPVSAINRSRALCKPVAGFDARARDIAGQTPART